MEIPSGGSSEASAFTFNPMPIITASSLDGEEKASTKVPQIFREPTMTSLGRLNSEAISYFSFRTLATARQAIWVNIGACAGLSGGLRRIEHKRFFPAGEIHCRPGLPLPSVWELAVRTSPSGSPCLARSSSSEFVEVVSSRCSMRKRIMLITLIPDPVWNGFNE